MASVEERLLQLENLWLEHQAKTNEKLAWLRKRIAMPNRRISNLEDQLSQLEETCENIARNFEQFSRNQAVAGSGSLKQNGTISDQLHSALGDGVGSTKKPPVAADRK